jgi:hypothetical protein
MHALLAVIAALTMTVSAAHKDAYVLSTGRDNNYNAGSSVRDLETVAKRFSGRYLWVRRGGREYLITDETTILRAEALFAPLTPISIEQSTLGQEESQIDREESRLEDQPHSDARDQRLGEIRARQRALEQREKELDAKEELLEREAEAAFWQLADNVIRAGQAKSVR